METEEQRTWEVEAGVSVFDGKPFVNIWSGEHSMQVRPAEALLLGLQLLHAANESEQQSALMAYLQTMGFSIEQCAVVLRNIRDTRESAIHDMLNQLGHQQPPQKEE